MATGSEHDVLLDQLQSQVNLILEQTGRIFAAIATNPKDRPHAQITKLKTTLPVATNQFHEALDQLESQIQLTTLVMRRDLAVSRERAGIQARPSAIPQQSSTPTVPPAVTKQATPPPKIDAQQPASNHIVPPPPAQMIDNDVTMSDWLEAPADQKSAPAPITPQPVSQPAPPPLADTKPSVAAHTLPTTTATTDIKPSTTPLQLDTNPSPITTTQLPPPTSDEKAPDTANDHDSLFNDPTSAHDTTNPNDFQFEHSGTTDIMDFTNFDATSDNDNIASLLPGLEQYANNQSTTTATGEGGDLDFNSLFNVTVDAANNDAMNSQGAGEQRDTTFDDLLNLADFEGMDDAGGEENNATGEAFDFDSLFN